MNAASNVLTERNWSVLSLLRFVLAFGVMTTHASTIVGLTWWDTLMPAFGGVAGFFVISGFSIAASHNARPAGFLRRRLLRVYPLSLLITTVAVASLYLMGGSVVTAHHGTMTLPTPAETISTLLLANGLLYATPFLLHPFWSLNCEMIYYAAAPWILKRATWPLCLLLALSAALHSYPPDGQWLRVYPEARYGQGAFGMLWGWLLGVLAFRLPNNLCLTLFAAILCNGLLVVFQHDGNTLAAVVYAIVAMCVCNLNRIRLPSSLVNLANYLGELSYSLYLVHYPISVLLGAALLRRMSPVADVGICWAASLLLSAALYHLVDRPIRKRRGVLKSAMPLVTHP